MMEFSNQGIILCFYSFFLGPQTENDFVYDVISIEKSSTSEILKGKGDDVLKGMENGLFNIDSDEQENINSISGRYSEQGYVAGSRLFPSLYLYSGNLVMMFHLSICHNLFSMQLIRSNLSCTKYYGPPTHYLVSIRQGSSNEQ